MLKTATIALCLAALALSGCMMPNHEESVKFNETKLAKEGIIRPQLGDAAPPFATTDATGQAASLAGMLEGGNYAVLFFYPANDTPNTAKHLMALAKAAPALAAQKVNVCAVNPSNQADGSAFLQRYGVSLPLLEDPGHAIAEMYGCALGADSFPQRTLVGIGPEAKILMYYRGFFPGPDPTHYILRELGLETKGNASPATSAPGNAAPVTGAPATSTPPASGAAPSPPGGSTPAPAPAPKTPGSGTPGK